MARTSSDGSSANFDWGDITFLDGADFAVDSGVLWSIWLKVATWNTNFQGIWNKDDYPTQNGGWGLQRDNANDNFAFFSRGIGSSTSIVMSGSPSFAGQGWRHIAGSMLGGNLFVYYQGARGTNTVAALSPFNNIANSMIHYIDNNNIALAEAAIFYTEDIGTSSAVQAVHDAMVAMLAKGFSPLLMPFRPIFYAPLIGKGTTEPDLMGRAAAATAAANSAATPGPALFNPKHRAQDGGGNLAIPARFKQRQPKVPPREARAAYVW